MKRLLMFRFSPESFTVALCWLLCLATPMPMSATGASDLFVTTVPVRLHHPPNLGFSIERVAFASATGDCSAEFVNALIEDFVRNDVAVIERTSIERILEELDFSASDYVQASADQSLGSLLGASALVFVDVLRCADEQSKTYKRTRTRDGSYTTFYSTTKFYFKSSLRIVDTLTGRVFSSNVVESFREDTNSSRDGYPEFPSAYELHDAAVEEAAFKVHQMFFPWTQIERLRFYKDRRCGLKDAYRLVEISDIEGAKEKSLANLEECRAQGREKSISRALYNVGMTHFLLTEYENALAYFEEAHRVRPNSRTTEAVNTCKRAMQLAEDMASYEALVAERAAEGGQWQPSALAAVVAQGRDTDEGSTTEAASEGNSAAERLQKLKALFDQGLITEGEYDAKRADILSDL